MGLSQVLFHLALGNESLALFELKNSSKDFKSEEKIKLINNLIMENSKLKIVFVFECLEILFDEEKLILASTDLKKMANFFLSRNSQELIYANNTVKILIEKLYKAGVFQELKLLLEKVQMILENEKNEKLINFYQQKYPSFFQKNIFPNKSSESSTQKDNPKTLKEFFINYVLSEGEDLFLIESFILFIDSSEILNELRSMALEKKLLKKIDNRLDEVMRETSDFNITDDGADLFEEKTINFSPVEIIKKLEGEYKIALEKENTKVCKNIIAEIRVFDPHHELLGIEKEKPKDLTKTNFNIKRRKRELVALIRKEINVEEFLSKSTSEKELIISKLIFEERFLELGKLLKNENELAIKSRIKKALELG